MCGNVESNRDKVNSNEKSENLLSNFRENLSFGKKSQENTNHFQSIRDNQFFNKSQGYSFYENGKK